MDEPMGGGAILQSVWRQRGLSDSEFCISCTTTHIQAAILAGCCTSSYALLFLFCGVLMGRKSLRSEKAPQDGGPPLPSSPTSLASLELPGPPETH